MYRRAAVGPCMRAGRRAGGERHTEQLYGPPDIWACRSHTCTHTKYDLIDFRTQLYRSIHVLLARWKRLPPPSSPSD